jgi:hypothetical protein
MFPLWQRECTKMSEPINLHPAEPDEVAQALSFALRFDGRKQFRHANEFAARITAEHLMRHLQQSGFLIMKAPPGSAWPGIRFRDGEGTHEIMTEQAPIDVHAAFRNVVQQLQVEPQRYKLFGVWWWPMKALLKRAGYGPDQIYMLGSYQDPETASQVPHEGLLETLQAAFAKFAFNATFPHPGGVVEAPDGEMVTIYDEDADRQSGDDGYAKSYARSIPDIGFQLGCFLE